MLGFKENNENEISCCSSSGNLIIKNLDQKLLRAQAEIFKAISHETRLAILHVLSDGEKCVNDIVQALGNKERTGVSRHLKTLIIHKLIDYREEGIKRFYFLTAHCLLDAVKCAQRLTDKKS